MQESDDEEEEVQVAVPEPEEEDEEVDEGPSTRRRKSKSRRSSRSRASAGEAELAEEEDEEEAPVAKSKAKKKGKRKSQRGASRRNAGNGTHHSLLSSSLDMDLHSSSHLAGQCIMDKLKRACCLVLTYSVCYFFDIKYFGAFSAFKRLVTPNVGSEAPESGAEDSDADMDDNQLEELVRCSSQKIAFLAYTHAPPWEAQCTMRNKRVSVLFSFLQRLED